MLKTLGGVSLAGIGPFFEKISGRSVFFKGSSQKLDTDILVVGGGTAGVIAAIQSARAGCSTLLILIYRVNGPVFATAANHPYCREAGIGQYDRPVFHRLFRCG